jgi:glycosyltransferase involved in cell wall biosynthesis
MNAPVESGERIVTVGGAAHAPRLSVVTPFHRHDPSPLLERLAHAPADVEFVLLDDGSGSAELLAHVLAAAERLGAPARVIVWSENRGRSAARNRLIGAARGEYVLFLDADMLPDARDFLRIWLGVIQTQRPFVAFGGLSLAHTAFTPETALHHSLFANSDCRPAHRRARAAAQFTASANLLVHRDVLAAHPFDDSFVGWGFEDVEWALRVVAHTPILHVDNPATHAGLDSVETLMRKSAEAGPNFARLARKHPREVSRFAAHRMVAALRLAPARRHVREACAWIARDPMGAAPMPLRRLALKLYRAAHYAEHLT